MISVGGKWKEIAERYASPLCWTLFFGGVDREMNHVTGLPLVWKKALFYDKHVCVDVTENEAQIQLMRNIIEDDITQLEDLGKRWIVEGESLTEVSRQYNETDYSEYDDEALLKDVLEWHRLMRRMSTAITLPIVVQDELAVILERLLRERGLNSEIADRYYRSFVFPDRESISTHEMVNFYTIASKLKSEDVNKDTVREYHDDSSWLQEALQSHLDEFAFVPARWFVGDGWTVEDLLIRLEALDWKEDFNARITEITSVTVQETAETARIMDELSFTDDERLLIRLIKDIVYIRTFRTDMMNRSGYLVRPLLNAVADKFEITHDQIIQLSWWELEESFETGSLPVSADTLDARKDFSWLCYIDNGRLEMYDGENAQKMVEQEGVVFELEERRELKGNIANRGVHEGVARVVLEAEDMESVQAGDVLVAIMTSPNLVPSMERAGAFVTDEGGITCHAAIISREMNKPCIIGTKDATRLIKNGDRVRVDGDLGVVTIL